MQHSLIKEITFEDWKSSAEGFPNDEEFIEECPKTIDTI
jgi:hypothetical protein